jgi:outer membrane protein assembly factor BamD (BamD/ComL family)
MSLEDTNNRTEQLMLTILVWFLSILAAVSVLIGLAAGVILLIRSASWLGAVISISGAFCVAGVLWALAWLCLRSYRQSQAEQKIISVLNRIAGELQAGSVRHIERGPVVSDAEDDPDVASHADRTEAILAQLRELNANLMLSDEQRQIKGQRLVGQHAQRLKQRLQEAISAGNLAKAEVILNSLTGAEPDSPDIPLLRERIKQARAEAEFRDADDAARQVENLMAASDFAGARTVAENFLTAHPDSTQASDMLSRITREAEAFSTEQRGQMYRKIEKAAASRNWHSALEAAKKFLDAYPDSTEADAVRVQLSTITDNARIAEVRVLRDRIRDLITRRRFGEAVDVAKDVIKRYPETAAATELREQLSRLEERAKSEADNSK